MLAGIILGCKQQQIVWPKEETIVIANTLAAAAWRRADDSLLLWVCAGSCWRLLPAEMISPRNCKLSIQYMNLRSAILLQEAGGCRFVCWFEKRMCFLAKSIKNSLENVLAELTVSIFETDEFKIANGFVRYFDDTRVFHEDCQWRGAGNGQSSLCSAICCCPFEIVP